MAIGIVGRKRGMTRVFTEEGGSIPVTVVEADPNRVTQVKTEESDGYRAVQVTAGRRKPQRVRKPEAGHFARAGVEAGRGVWEFRLDKGQRATDEELPEAGASIEVGSFEAGQKVDVTGTSKGRGFAGTVRRHNFRAQRNTHGNSKSHRVPGSIGQCQSPGRVFKGKKMAGQMGNRRATVQNLEVVRVDSERNLLLIRGAVPGAVGSDLIVRPASKA
ncbi:MAG: 50S ribosomal protein L3 [Halorhodospira halophila]|uniref:50S ribosomal protein L3 n=1 Tax=Halorhodospira TaxID=85108 RepID=UPI00191236E5|nr:MULTISPECIES: 50S ribosomal protein L3 [Halorhodospira]MBK5943124.1 50S ribosomal protein L3 [Halorhodospira halophila]MCC3750891.1 50S ribosomal protein L3 [Halorhodospira halophila]MCG5528939.1 50S ribosomal protein L3 [Halorhodospira halophila]MCG5533740.1 50S ribosomal protein L3 [Halorhodospira sp. 9621]MCG5539160.1 50S ribosomal protein L3 [Halorhodospira sp. 9622]